MKPDGNDRSTAAVFVADCHFHVEPDAAELQRRAEFVDLLDGARAARHLVLLGDVFDFWFDYPHFILKGYEDILQALDRVRDAGTRVHFVGGNHDIWAAPYLHHRYGSSRDGGPLDLDVDGLRIRCLHGDGLLGKELAYRAFRAAVRHPVGIWLGKVLHPEALYVLSTGLSGHSRQADRDEVAGIEAKAARYLRRVRRQDVPWDILVIGHVHHPLRLTDGARTLLALGGWLERRNYAVLGAGELTHAVYARDCEPDGAAAHPAADI